MFLLVVVLWFGMVVLGVYHMFTQDRSTVLVPCAYWLVTIFIGPFLLIWLEDVVDIDHMKGSGEQEIEKIVGPIAIILMLWTMMPFAYLIKEG